MCGFNFSNYIRVKILCGLFLLVMFVSFLQVEEVISQNTSCLSPNSIIEKERDNPRTYVATFGKITIQALLKEMRYSDSGVEYEEAQEDRPSEGNAGLVPALLGRSFIEQCVEKIMSGLLEGASRGPLLLSSEVGQVSYTPSGYSGYGAINDGLPVVEGLPNRRTKRELDLTVEKPIVIEPGLDDTRPWASGWVEQNMGFDTESQYGIGRVLKIFQRGSFVKVGSQRIPLKDLLRMAEYRSKILGDKLEKKYGLVSFLPFRMLFLAAGELNHTKTVGDKAQSRDKALSLHVHSRKEYQGSVITQDETYYAVTDVELVIGLKEGVTIERFYTTASDDEIADENGLKYKYKKCVYLKLKKGEIITIPAGVPHALIDGTVLEVSTDVEYNTEDKHGKEIDAYTFRLADASKDTHREMHPFDALQIITFNGPRGNDLVERLKPKRTTIPQNNEGVEVVKFKNSTVLVDIEEITIRPSGEFLLDTQGVFHGLQVVEGEKVIIETKRSSGVSDTTTLEKWGSCLIPGSISSCRIKNEGKEPVKIINGYLSLEKIEKLDKPEDTTSEPRNLFSNAYKSNPNNPVNLFLKFMGIDVDSVVESSVPSESRFSTTAMVKIDGKYCERYIQIFGDANTNKKSVVLYVRIVFFSETPFAIIVNIDGRITFMKLFRFITSESKKYPELVRQYESGLQDYIDGLLKNCVRKELPNSGSFRWEDDEKCRDLGAKDIVLFPTSKVSPERYEIEKILWKDYIQKHIGSLGKKVKKSKVVIFSAGQSSLSDYLPLRFFLSGVKSVDVCDVVVTSEDTLSAGISYNNIKANLVLARSQNESESWIRQFQYFVTDLNKHEQGKPLTFQEVTTGGVTEKTVSGNLLSGSGSIILLDIPSQDIVNKKKLNYWCDLLMYLLKQTNNKVLVIGQTGDVMNNMVTTVAHNAGWEIEFASVENLQMTIWQITKPSTSFLEKMWRFFKPLTARDIVGRLPIEREIETAV